MSKDYEARVLSQIEQYKDDLDIHNLPEVFQIWSQAYLRPALNDVFGIDTIEEVFSEAFLASAPLAEGQPTFLSLGCGDGLIEMQVARRLFAKGLRDFNFVCLDISPILIERFRNNIPPDLVPYFTLRAEDINNEAIPAVFHAAMAHHSLHHMVNLEDIFAAVYAGLHENGLFVTCDMIGRNGHMRWPEAKLFVDFFWPFLTSEQRTHKMLKRHEPGFLDYDCSGESFEGIRAQDILPAILQAGFRSQKFLGHGGFIDVFVDRGFGHNFSITNPDDVFLIQRIGHLNELLLNAGLIKPTMMFAHFAKHSAEECCYRGRTAAASVRPTDTEPDWLKWALSDFSNIPVDPGFTYKSSSSDIESLDPAITELQSALREKEAEIEALRESTSWRLTAPLRALRHFLSGTYLKSADD